MIPSNTKRSQDLSPTATEAEAKRQRTTAITLDMEDNNPVDSDHDMTQTDSLAANTPMSFEYIKVETEPPADDDASSQEKEKEKPGIIAALQSAEIAEVLDNCKILVIGAGGLGCEILKNLALTGFKHLHVIDMDTIDISNLNRQFLFRAKDIGKSKAIVAADFVMNRVPGVKIEPYFGKIQDKDDDYYMQFQIVVCGLDSVEARRWINAKLVDMMEEDDQNTWKALIDGGTEGFKGQARVILPKMTSCYECSLDMLNKGTTYPICTIANTPRLPEHCIEWASVLEWPRVWGEKKCDNDNPEHIQWLYEQAKTRAAQFDITGITYSLTQGVVKNIIPAIASTNAVVAASCCNEVFKIATAVGPYLNNYMMYTGNDGVYTFTFEHQKKPECPVCGNNSLNAELDPKMTLTELIEWLQENPETQLKKPSLRTAKHSLYMQAPPPLEQATRANLTEPIRTFLGNGDFITVTDAALPVSLEIKVKWKPTIE